MRPTAKEARKMKDIIYTIIPEGFWIVRKDYLEKELKTLPVIHKGTRNNRPVYRIYDNDHHHYREISEKNSKWSDTEALFIRRNMIIQKLKTVTDIIRTNYHNDVGIKCKVINNSGYCDSSFYDGLEDSSCSVENKTEYFYKGRYYRSRIEMLIAGILDELGIEFKYDVKININGKIVTIDFVLLFREFNRCSFLEFYGKCEEPEYNHTNSVKIEHLTNSGFYLGRDYFVISGNKTYAPGIDVIRIFIASIVAELSARHIRKVS